MRYRSLGLLLLCLFVLPTIVLAQGSADWRIALFARQENTIYVMTPQGVQQAILLPTYQGNAFIAQQISRDYHYAAGLIEIPGATENDAPVHLPAIADLQAATCCVIINPPMTTSEEFFIQFSNFNDDGTHIIISTNNFAFDPNGGAGTGGGVMSMVDVATGQILDQIAVKDSFAYLAGWQADGVRFLRAPLGGTEWLAEGHYSLWDIQAGTIRDNIPEVAIWRGDVLPITGEIVEGAYDPDFPTIGFGMITPANVIEYYSAGRNPFMNPAEYHTPGDVVFYNPHDLDLQTTWVDDGHAFLVHNGIWTVSDTVTVVLRGGQQLVVNTPGQRYLTATTNGWLMYDSAGTVYSYTNTGDGYSSAQLARLAPPVQDSYLPYLASLNTLMLGSTVSGDEPGFPIVTHTPPAVPPNAVTCPGALPSRLIAGEQGWVLPGDSNNLRDKPSKAGAKIGELQAGMGFDVVEGPVCADGYAWWHVKDPFNQDGWTAEGDAKDYWVEPIR